jgi:hypothetical protein
MELYGESLHNVNNHLLIYFFFIFSYNLDFKKNR